jgi:hypothetical protein
MVRVEMSRHGNVAPDPLGPPPLSRLYHTNTVTNLIQSIPSPPRALPFQKARSNKRHVGRDGPDQGETALVGWISSAGCLPVRPVLVMPTIYITNIVSIPTRIAAR